MGVRKSEIGRSDPSNPTHPTLTPSNPSFYGIVLAILGMVLVAGRYLWTSSRHRKSEQVHSPIEKSAGVGLPALYCGRGMRRSRS